MDTPSQGYVTSSIERGADARLASIDIFRGLTLLCMLFVNDLWSLHDIPAWLEHAPAEADALGFADVVFPAFLFIVGLSIPLALERRLRRGDSLFGVARHVTLRFLALLVMGLFHVNMEYSTSELLPIPRGLWSILMTLAFFLIWNAYETEGIRVRFLQGIGIALLAGMALTYRGGSAEAPTGMQAHWWGILGLIGWAYLLCSVLYLCLRRHPVLAWLVGFVLLLLNMQECWAAGRSSLRLVISASNHALVWAGVLTTLLAVRLGSDERKRPTGWVFLGPAAAFLSAGLILRPLWGISKIRATPSWTLVCTGIALVAWTLLRWIADRRRQTRWCHWLAPAARSTLTCYLLPYLIYPLAAATGLTLPPLLTGGLPGLCKSLAFALLIITLAGLLERTRIRLKI